jgi:hypothetical protein
MLLGYPGGRLALRLCSIVTRTSREASMVGTSGLIRIHPPLVCPTGLTLSRGSGDGRQSHLPDWLVQRGKRSRLVRHLRERYSAVGERLVHGIRTRVIRMPLVGQGLSSQALEVMRCVRNPDMPRAASCRSTSQSQSWKSVDEVRREWTSR